ncbi:hypothetical protein EJ07DRAFT_82742, partial [Lizonia empirigonia]
GSPSEPKPEGAVPNASPTKWMTAVERKCYQKRGLQTQGEGWFICTEGDGAFDYRLVIGV